MDILKALYLETIIELVRLDLKKANTHGNVQANRIEKIRQSYEPMVSSIVEKFCRKTNANLKKANLSFLEKHFSKVSKSDNGAEKVKKQLQELIEEAIASDLSEDIISELQEMVDEVTTSLSSSLNLSVNFKLVNQRAIDFLKNSMQNTFSSLSDDSAQGIYNKIADAMSNTEDGYSLKSIIGNIMDDAFALSDNGFISTASRNIPVSDWVQMVATSETARASSASTRSVAEDAGLSTWTACANVGACDICEDNNGETVSIGDPFPSGDTESPFHVSCRCVCILNREEIDALFNSDDSED